MKYPSSTLSVSSLSPSVSLLSSLSDSLSSSLLSPSASSSSSNSNQIRSMGQASSAENNLQNESEDIFEDCCECFSDTEEPSPVKVDPVKIEMNTKQSVNLNSGRGEVLENINQFLEWAQSYELKKREIGNKKTMKKNIFTTNEGVRNNSYSHTATNQERQRKEFFTDLFPESQNSMKKTGSITNSNFLPESSQNNMKETSYNTSSNFFPDPQDNVGRNNSFSNIPTNLVKQRKEFFSDLSVNHEQLQYVKSEASNNFNMPPGTSNLTSTFPESQSNMKKTGYTASSNFFPEPSQNNMMKSDYTRNSNVFPESPQNNMKETDYTASSNFFPEPQNNMMKSDYTRNSNFFPESPQINMKETNYTASSNFFPESQNNLMKSDYTRNSNFFPESPQINMKETDYTASSNFFPESQNNLMKTGHIENQMNIPEPRKHFSEVQRMSNFDRGSTYRPDLLENNRSYNNRFNSPNQPTPVAQISVNIRLCSLCDEDLTSSVTKQLPCGHVYHEQCLKSLWKNDLINYCDLCES